MADHKTFEELTRIFQDVFDSDDVVAAPALTAADIPGWDSLVNVRLFLALEEELKIRFGAAEMAHLKNVGELADLIEKKRAAR